MRVLRTGAYESFYDFPLAVNWLITNRCNYHCSYCFDRGGVLAKESAKKPLATLAQLKAAVDNIASLNRPWYDVTLSGGEPTVHPHLFDLIAMLHEKLGERLNRVTIITNGSRNASLYEKLAGIAKSVNILMQISLHTDHVDMKHILELVELLSRDVDIYFALMFNPDKRDRVYEIFDTMLECRKKFYFTLNVVTLRDGDRVDPRYTRDDFAWQKAAVAKFEALAKDADSNLPARKKSERCMHVFHELVDGNGLRIAEQTNRTLELADGLLKFKGMYCIAHAALLRIEENGFCRGMVCGADPVICNIYEENSLKAVRNELIHPIRCPLEICGCASNDRIPKFVFLQEALRFVEVIRKKQQALSDAAH